MSHDDNAGSGGQTPFLELDARPHRGTKDYPGGQVEMIRRALRYKYLTMPCGRRVGKTTSIFFLWLQEQAEKRGRYMTGYVATDHAKAREFQGAFFRAMGGDPKKNPSSLVVGFSNDQGQDRWVETLPLDYVDEDGREIRLNEGGKFYFWSGQHPHYQAIQGFIFPFDRIVVDEMQLQHPQLVTEVIVPMLMDSDGKLLLTGHPKKSKPGNFLFREYYRRGQASSPEWREYGALNMPAEANPFIKRSVIKSGRRACLTPEEEQEEYDGTFVEGDGGVFLGIAQVMVLKAKKSPQWWREFRLKHPLKGVTAWFHKDYHPRKKYVIGVDWAKQRDATIISVFDRTSNDQACVVRIRGELYEDQLKYLHAIRERYGNALIHGDNNGVGEAMGERLAIRYKSGYKAHKWSATSKELYVRRGQIIFKERLIRMIDVAEQRMEFEEFSLIPPKVDDGMGGKMHAARYGHLPGKHDDFVDAFLMLTESLSHNPVRESSKKKAPDEFSPGTLQYVLALSRGLRGGLRGVAGAAARRIGPGGL